MKPETTTLEADGLQWFAALRREAIDSVAARFYREHAAIYAQFGDRGREACREDLGYHLEFLRPVLEFGLAGPMVEYLRWLAGVLQARAIPSEHLPKSLDWLAEFFDARGGSPAAAAVVAALHDVKAKFISERDFAPAIDSKMPAAWPDCAEFENALPVG